MACVWCTIQESGGDPTTHRQMTIHTLLLDGCQKFAFAVSENKINVCKSIRHHRIKHKFDWAGSVILSKEDARILWKTLIDGGAIRI